MPTAEAATSEAPRLGARKHSSGQENVVLRLSMVQEDTHPYLSRELCEYL